MSKLGRNLYSGQLSVNFIERRRRWYVITAVVLLISILAIVLRGLNLGIEFKGGADFTLPAAQCSVEEARSTAQEYVSGQPIVTVSAAGVVRVQTGPVSTELSREITAGLADACGIPANTVKSQVVGPSWGSEISTKAIQGVLIFLALVMLFLSFYFNWRMAVGAVAAVIFDLTVTTGIYSLTGLEVTPATVIGLLTILAYSLYDTVVVFDKVKENTRSIAGQSVLTYPEAANLAVNQTVIRSINTSIVAILPVLAIIVIGGWYFGAGTLLDLAVVLAIGLAAGTFSSIFIATPILVDLAQRQPEMKSLEARVAARRAQVARASGEAGDQDVPAGAAPQIRLADITTKTISAERNQPKRTPRSKRGKKS
jgi:preprotein translocase subunit SecF